MFSNQRMKELIAGDVVEKPKMKTRTEKFASIGKEKHLTEEKHPTEEKIPVSF